MTTGMTVTATMPSTAAALPPSALPPRMTPRWFAHLGSRTSADATNAWPQTSEMTIESDVTLALRPISRAPYA